MNKELKKIIVVFLCLVTLSLNLVVQASNNVDTEDLIVTNNEVTYTDEFEMDFEVEGLTYYPFVYDENNTWFIENVIGPTNCQQGYLYVKNLDTGNIIKLVSQPVDVIRTKGNGGYFIYMNNIFYVTYDNGNIVKIYESNGTLNNSILEIYEDELYFCENNKIVKYNEETREKNNIATANNVTMLYIKSDKEVVYEENNNIHYIDRRTAARGTTNRIITNEYEYNSLFVGTNEEPDVSVDAATSQIDTNFASLEAQYPHGSYFSKSGNRCTHHGNCSYNGSCGCKSVFETIQCVAYAKWASNQYAHMTTWNSNEREYGEGYDTDVAFDKAEDVRVYFANCAPGAYVRLTKRKGDDNGFHSILYVRTANNSIVSRECNLYGGCDVNFITRTFDSFRSFSPASSYYTTHSYSRASRAVQYDSSYHKQYCLNNSRFCEGYRMEAHYSNTPGASSRCAACGYVGNITYTYPLG